MIGLYKKRLANSTKEVDSSYIEVYCVGTDDSYQYS